MSFDTSLLDAACLADDFSDDAIWITASGTKSLQVIFNVGGEYENDEGVKIRVGDSITAGTLASDIAKMKRGDALKIKGDDYAVLGFDPDGSGWVDILLERL